VHDRVGAGASSLWIRLSGAGAAQRGGVTAALFIALETMNRLVTQ
jgi:hypothetical protein